MTMNKREQAEFDAAKKAVVVARALNWSDPVLPDLPVPACGQPDTIGFTFNRYAAQVLFARSSSIGHATSNESTPARTTTQGSIPLYSTKLLALKALRHAVEKECAEKLAGIDMQIQQEPPP